ncbi:p53 regulated pa26 nuclear protein [Stylonychia lemnae]|uniref:p53 regulated pa26 nuclear protein n=1 Tax=Stylonychia lemnae TaxID=5949 RepID=A0A078B5E0_STYLE|nr:p53 regulated pa26 nuclear protein [Stylonychia lemnae]|eukprot:CDW89406.1 p53 regulated pa26 nuclear protein [Stylonychia lemnae]
METKFKEKPDKQQSKQKSKSSNSIQDNKNFTLQKVFKNFLLLDSGNRQIYVFKRFAFECPIRDISDEFYRVLVKYQTLPLSQVTNKEDDISSFYNLDQVPQIFETPLELTSASGQSTVSEEEEFQVKRGESMFNAKDDGDRDPSCNSYDNDSEIDLQQLLIDIFITNGRLLHHERILCFFPEYLQLQFKIQNDIMNSLNILPVTHRYYLSIMAVSCYNCEYLLKIQEEQFILNGGDIKWLQKGLKAVDPKLVHIAPLNEMLAHKPWAVDSYQLEFLLNIQKPNEKWNFVQIVHATLILVHYHSLCGVIFGQGLKEEVRSSNSQLVLIQIDLPLNFDLTSKRSNITPDKQSKLISGKSSDQQQEIAEKDIHPKKVHFQISEEKMPIHQTIIFESTSEDYTTDSNFIEDSSEETQQIKLIETETDIFSKHRENKIISYTDFKMNNDKFLFSSYFSWDLNAIEILSQWAPDITENLDSIFRLILQSEYKFSHDETNRVDSQYMIDCISMYVKRIFGVDESESFDYQMVNKVFPVAFKIFVKKVACYPQLINKEIYNQANSINLIRFKEDSDSRCHTPLASTNSSTDKSKGNSTESLNLSVKDKLYLNLVAIESKRQISLLYISKAISDHLKN